MDALVDLAKGLSRDLSRLTFSDPVSHVYDPLTYAWAPHEQYLRRFAATGRVVLVGMNPGPYGMAQTGVPFGEIVAVRDWMGIEAPVGRPDPEHPKRPVTGFATTRSEISGQRLWGWARDRFGTAGAFFQQFFVVNWCPLCFMEHTGRNRTPDKLRPDERDRLYAVCDAALRAQFDVLKPSFVLGVGTFAEARARVALQGRDVPVGRILHPSPASPAANRGWAEAVERELRDQGVLDR